MFRFIRPFAALALMTVGVIGVAAPAQAHTAVGGATCAGAVLDATSYDAAMANTYSLTVDQETVAGTFGDSTHQTVAVPQDGAVHTWSYSVAAEDGSFQFSDSGQVGPCGGTPQVFDACPDLSGDQPADTACTPPPDHVVSTHATALDCDDEEQVTTTTTTTTPFEFDQTTQTWVAGTPVEVQQVSSQPVQPRDCSQSPVDECSDVNGVQTHPCGVGHPTTVHWTATPTASAPPAAVLPDAGAVAAAGNPGSDNRLLGAGILAGGLLLGGLALRRRQTLAS